MDPLLDQLSRSLGGAYRIERELGGGMSRVFLATESALGRRVVLKVLPPDLARDVSAERFKREISLAANLQHAHIVPLLSAGEAEGVPWFTMPLVDGQSLRERLASGELPIAETVRLLRDVASALSYAHGKGVVHRDIKPENILIADGAAFVSDFGVSKAVTEAGAAKGMTFTSVGVALGTPAYMSPEQIGAEKGMDHRADIYAFGVVAYEILTGRNPFAGRSTQATMAAHMTETPPPVDTQRASTPPALAQLVTRCLAKSAADRPQKAQEIVDTLDALTTPTGSIPLSTGSVATLGASRRWRGVTAVAVVVVLGGAFAAWTAFRGPTLDPHRVAVIPFANLTGDPALSVVGQVASEELSRSIAQTDSADVVSSAATQAVLGDAANLTADQVKRVAQATRAATIVTGSYSRVGDSLRVQASIVDARSGRVTRALDPTVGPIRDPMVAIAALRERILGSIVSGDAARAVVLGSTPPKYSAYLELVAAEKMFVKNQAAARPFLERAIAIDSTFIAAYGLLATIHTNAGRFEEAERLAARLDVLRDGLSTFDRLSLEFLHAHNRYVPEPIIPLAQEMYDRSGDPTFAYLVGFWNLRILHAERALAALKIADSSEIAGGWIGQVRDVAQAYHELGDYRSELNELDRGIRLLPQFTGTYRATKLRAFAGLRDSASALALADTLLRAVMNDTLVTTANNVRASSNEFAAHGDSLTARRMREMTLAWLHDHSVKASTRARERTLGYIWFDHGDLDSAEVHFRAARDSGVNGVNVAGYLGVVAAQRGDSVRASATADSLAAHAGKYDHGLSTMWRAAIAANLGKRDNAIQLLRQAVNTGQPMFAFHSAANLAPLRGYRPFEEMIAPKKN